MKNNILRVIFLIVLLCTTVFLIGEDSIQENDNKKQLPHFFDNEDNTVLANKIVDEMTDAELLSQVFMFGWLQLDPDEGIIDWVKEGLGSIKIFGRNTSDTYKLANSIKILQDRALNTRFGIPLFVATDQEGGLVRHVKGLTTVTPGNLAIGASGVPMDSYYAGYYISKELASIGINLNFAPTVDLYTDHESSVIEVRSFGENPKLAGVLGEAFMRGSLDAGVLTTAKHFPGHGDTKLDSHGRLPEINISKELFYSRELVPFKHLIDAGVPAIMTGHLSYPCLAPRGMPATFSKHILIDLLRNELGFKGLIITDDMNMYGAQHYTNYNEAKSVMLAIKAGNDIIESSKTPKKRDELWTENLKLMSTDAEFYHRVKDSATRIIIKKLEYFKGKNFVNILPETAKIPETLPARDGYVFFQSLAARSVTVLRDKEIPYAPKQNEQILLAGEYADFLTAGKRRFPNAKTSSLIDAVYSRARNADTIIFCVSENYSVDVLKKLQAMYPRKKYIAMLSRSPVFFEKIKDIETAIAIYSYSDFSFIAGFAALCGDYKPTGTMPLIGIE